MFYLFKRSPQKQFTEALIKRTNENQVNWVHEIQKDQIQSILSEMYLCEHKNMNIQVYKRTTTDRYTLYVDNTRIQCVPESRIKKLFITARENVECKAIRPLIEKGTK